MHSEEPKAVKTARLRKPAGERGRTWSSYPNKTVTWYQGTVVAGTPPYCHCGRPMTGYDAADGTQYFLCDEHDEASVCRRCARPFDESDVFVVGRFRIGLVHEVCPVEAITERRLTAIMTGRDEAVQKLSRVHDLELQLEAITLERDHLDRERQTWGPRYNETARRCALAEARIEWVRAAWKRYARADDEGTSGLAERERARSELERALFSEDL